MDASHLDPSKFYLVSGKTLADIKDRQDRLWGGDNIQRGPGIFRRGSGTGGFSLAARGGGGNAPSFAAATSFPWNLYNKTVGATGQVQVNGGDGQVAQLNGFICNVNGSPSDTKTGSPAAYPQLAVTGNGYIYAYVVPTTPGTASPLTSLDLYYQGSAQSQDTANPATYYWMLVATISNYAVDGSGNVSFSVNNVYGSAYGPATLLYCGTGGAIQVY